MANGSNVGIGYLGGLASNPAFKLHIMDYLCLGPYNNQAFAKGILFTRINNPNPVGLNGLDWGLDSDGGGLNFWKPFSSPNAGNFKFFIKDDGKVAIGGNTIASGYIFQVYGSSTGIAWNSSSDGRLKENIAPLGNGLEAIMQLKPMLYNYKAPIISEKGSQKPEFQHVKDYSDPNFDTKKWYYGFIAQDVQEVLPDLVTGEETDSTFLSLNYDGIIPVLVNSIQELKQQLDAISSTERYQNSSGQLVQTPVSMMSDDISLKFNLPASSSNTLLIISNLEGKEIKKIKIQPLQQEYILKQGVLEAGSYWYTLIIDGNEADTKKLIVTTP